MTNRVLQYGDGIKSPELKNDVKKLQMALQEHGFSLKVDGEFGNMTLEAVRYFQLKEGLDVDGIVGPKTWEKLVADSEEEQIEVFDTPALSQFHGDAAWVHAREGHAGKTYWPGGASGITLDPGIDLGYVDAALFCSLYQSILTPTQFAEAKSVFGIRGDSAAAELRRNSVLQSIRISRSQADKLFPYAAKPYWDRIVARFPILSEETTLGSVQTALLSLSYNRGSGNSGLEPLKEPLNNKDWRKVADIIAGMQQNHRLEGIRRRRRMEAQLIYDELG